MALAAKVASALGCSEATPSHVLAAWARLLLRQSEAAVLAVRAVSLQGAWLLWKARAWGEGLRGSVARW